MCCRQTFRVTRVLHSLWLLSGSFSTGQWGQLDAVAGHISLLTDGAPSHLPCCALQRPHMHILALPCTHGEHKARCEGMLRRAAAAKLQG